MLLFSNGADIIAFKHGTPILSPVSTPVLKAILDECLKGKDEPVTSADIMMKVKYEFLNNIVPHMSENQ